MDRKLYLSSLFLVAMSGACLAGEKTSENWLVGTWVLCEDPDNSPKDSLKFNADGPGLSIRPKGNIELLHRHSGQDVQLLANANGYAIPIQLKASESFDKLMLYSDKTKNTSIYVRDDSPLAEDCSVK